MKQTSAKQDMMSPKGFLHWEHDWESPRCYEWLQSTHDPPQKGQNPLFESGGEKNSAYVFHAIASNLNLKDCSHLYTVKNMSRHLLFP